MKSYWRISLLLIFVFVCLQHSVLYAQAGFDRQAYFTAFAKNETAVIDEQLKQTELLSGDDQDAFEGALLMRKAGVVFSPGQKLSLFKQGAKKLEAAIKAHPQNAEYRFLRLMIQENAPGFIGYNENMETDSDIVKRQMKSLSKPTQDAIGNYSRQSKYL